MRSLFPRFGFLILIVFGGGLTLCAQTATFSGSIVTAQAQDVQLRTFALAVEDLRKVPNVPWMSQLIVRLPSELTGVPDVDVIVSARGLASNAARIRLK